MESKFQQSQSFKFLFQSEHPARIGSPSSTIEHHSSNACSFCRRQKVTSKRNNLISLLRKSKDNKNFSDSCFVLSQSRVFQSLTPTLDNSMRYIVFKDKKGKYFCEFCAPLDSKKVNSQYFCELTKYTARCKVHHCNLD